MNDVTQRAVKIIAGELATLPGRLSASTEFVDDLQLDALEMTSLAMAMEAAFRVVFEPGAEQQWVTVGDAVRAVEFALHARPPVLFALPVALQA